jgi:hypothetical protein
MLKPELRLTAESFSIWEAIFFLHESIVVKKVIETRSAEQAGENKRIHKLLTDQ